VHIAEKLRLKDLKDRLSVAPQEFSNYEMVLQYGPESYAFFYNYGSAVFFNVPDDVQERELGALQGFRSSASLARTSDAFLLEVQPAGVATAPEVANRVFFDRLVVSQLSFAKIKITCMLIAESSGLEYYELLTEELLERAGVFTKKLERQGRFLESSEDLIKFIGMCLNTKQEIISNLYIVDSPDETWESVELDKVFQELKTMFEIDTRYRALDYKIKIIQESLEIIVDLAKSKRENKLEMIIILLIAFEVVFSLVKEIGWL
jgi:uncharacterized Rmd1/YagE family protein